MYNQKISTQYRLNVIRNSVDRFSLMQHLRKMKKSSLVFWVILLSIALLSAQGVMLHVHAVDHDHHQRQTHNHDSLLDQQPTAEHTHISIAHLSADTSHSDHHDRVIYENDACPDCLLTKISHKAPVTALIFMLFILLLTGVCRQSYKRRRDDNIHFSWRFHFTPPLRAPPYI